MLNVTCPHCRRSLSAPGELAGQTASCCHCQKTMQLPGIKSSTKQATEDTELSHSSPGLAQQLRAIEAEGSVHAEASRPKLLPPIRAIKARRICKELRSVRGAMQAAFGKLALQLIDENPEVVDDEDQRQLTRLLAETVDLKGRLLALTSVKATSHLARQVKEQLAHADNQRSEVLARIGETAYQTGLAPESSRSQLSVFQELSDGLHQQLATMGIDERVHSRAIRNSVAATAIGLLGIVVGMASLAMFMLTEDTPVRQPQGAGHQVAEVEIVPSVELAPALVPAAPSSEDDVRPLLASNQQTPTIDEPEEEPVALVPPFDSSVWQPAGFLMVNPTQFAVGIVESANANYQVVAKAVGPDAQRAVHFAEQGGMPIIAIDPPLTREVYTRYEPGARVSESHAARIREFFRPRQFGPSHEQLVAFRDIRDQQWHVGELSREERKFHPLLEPQAIEFNPDHILPGSLRRMSPTELREWKEFDFLDYCVYQVGKHLSDVESGAYIAVAIDEVNVDINLEAELETIRMLVAKRSKLSSEQWSQFMQTQELNSLEARSRREFQGGLLGIGPIFGGFSSSTAGPDAAERDWLRQVRADYLNRKESQQERQRREHEEEERIRLNIDQFKRKLQGELRQRLLQLNVPVVERESLESVLQERQLAEKHPGEFQSRDASGYGRLAGATHIVLTNIRWPTEAGSYQLDIRVGDLRHGNVLWSGQRDRIFKHEIETEVTSLRCLLATGRLAAAEFAGGTTPQPKSMSVPLELRSLASYSPTSSAVPPKSLLYVERSPTPDSLCLRDLFSNQLYTWPRNRLRLAPVTDSLSAVPQGHEMRYVLWRLAKSVLPPGGRVLGLDNGVARIALGRSHGIKVADRLGAVRFEPATTESGQVIRQAPLSIELIVRTLDEEECTASIETIGEHTLKVDDVAVAKKGQRMQVAIVPPDWYLADTSLQVAWRLKNGPQRTRILGHARQVSWDIASKVNAGMTKLQVPLVQSELLAAKLGRNTEQRLSFWDAGESADAAKKENATHLILGTVSPLTLPLGSQPPRCMIDMAVVHVDRGEFVDRFQFELKPSELNPLNDWTP